MKNIIERIRELKKEINLVILMLFINFKNVFAMSTGNVSNAIEGAWKDTATQVKVIVNNVVFPAVSLILAVLFFVKLAMTYTEYKKSNQIEYMGLIILFMGLIISLTAKNYIWGILGI